VTSSEGAERDETREAAGEDLDLTDEQADSVKGGVKNSDIVVTRPVDKPSNCLLYNISEPTRH
jgi:hypothetical protein